MTGAKRNSYLAGLAEETGKTAGQVTKAAAILNANRLAKGKSSNVFLRSIGQYHTESISEFKDYVLNIEKDIAAREDGQARSQQEHEAKLLEREIEAREDIQAHQLEAIDRKGEWDVKKAEISAFSFQKDQDSDDNGVPDQLEIEKLRYAAESARKKAELDNKKIDSDNYNKAEDRKLKEKEIKAKMAQKPTPKK